MREDAIAEYHEILATDEGLTPEFLAGLKEKMRARRLVYGAREIGIALRPHFLTSNQYEALAHASGVLAGALNKVAAALVADESLLASVGLRDNERRFAVAPTGFDAPAVTTRFDAFVYGDEIKFVEYNAENPSSLSDQEGLNQILFETRALQRLAERYRLRQFNPLRSLLESLLTTFREWSGGSVVPNVAIVDWDNLPTASEFMLLRNYFAGCGVPTVICTPDELEYTDGKLRRGDFRIDLVYKRIVIHEFLARYDETHPLSRAYFGGHVCVVNPFRCKILHKKAIFEWLTDDERAGWLSETEREVAARCVPWTRVLTERKTQYRGQTIDLAEFVRKNRASFVLKPNDDYGGHGIFFGKDTGATEWDAMIAVALSKDYVVQEILNLHMEEFPIFDEQRWSIQPMYVDVNPFMFNGKADGAMVRLSDSPIVNVTSGGGETGFFVIEGRVA